MRRISISELSSLRWSFYHDVVRYAAHGFDSIGVWRQKIEDFDELEAVDLLFEMQMNVSSVHWAGGFTGGDGKSHLDAVADAIDAIHLTSRLNADCLIVHPGSRNGHTARHAHRLFSTALQTLVSVAEDFGVKLAIEPMPCRSASAWTFLQKLECSLELINRFSSDNLGLVLDLYHVGLNPDVFDDLEQFVDQIAMVQVADRKTHFSLSEQRQLLGTGIVPLGKWFSRLQSLGYTGRYEVELHGNGMVDRDYHAMLRSTAEFFQDEAIETLLDSSTDPPRLRRSSNQ